MDFANRPSGGAQAGGGAGLGAGGASPADTAHVLWVSSGGCEGCTMAVLGATSPRLEELLGGSLTQIPNVELHHPALALESGEAFLARLDQARHGQLDPFLLVVEGSMLDQGYGRMGRRDGVPVAPEQRIVELAPRAAAVLAIGSCATSGGIPAAAGGTTGARSLQDLLGAGFRSAGGLPVVNVPGCAVSGDGFIEALQYVLLHLGGLVPLDLDELQRPRWLFNAETDVVGPAVGARVTTALTAGCCVPARGWINRLGGCALVGGACTGCTRSDYPDVPLAALEG